MAHIVDAAKRDGASSKDRNPVRARTLAAAAILLSVGLAGCTSPEPPASAASTAAAEPASTPTAAPTSAAAPAPTATPSAKPSLDGQTVVDSFGNTAFYTTVPGDTLAMVAAVSRFSEAEVAGFNSLQPGAPLTPGTTLRLMSDGPLPGAMGEAIVGADGIPRAYTIEAGDTLEGITYRFNLTEDQLAEANKTRSVRDNVYFSEPGSFIDLQKDPVDSRSGTGDAVHNSWDRAVFYTTVDGDSFNSVGYQFRLSTGLILYCNPSLAVSSPIPVGTKLQLIPGDRAIEGAQGTYTADSEGIPLTYTTVAGDTERWISFRFGVTVLADANRLAGGSGEAWYQYTDPSTGELAPGQTISLSLDQPISKPGT